MAAPTLNRPVLADVYFDWEAEGRTTTPVSTGGIVAIAATSNYGPINTPILLTDESKLYTAFGDGDTPLHRAVRDAFKGQGYNGKNGASAVLAIRQAVASGGGAAAKATKTLMNTAGTPAVAITLTAKEPGTRANDLRLTVQAGTDAGTNELLVLDGSLVVERYVHTDTAIAGLVTTINETSDWFDATAGDTTAKLATVSATALTGGADGATLTGAEWAATFAALDRDRWAIFAPYGLTDTTIRAAVVAWIKQRNSLGARSWAIVGGAAGETLSTANSRSQAINHWDIINLGRGTLRVVSEDREVSTAELVARYAGARAWRGEARDDIYVRFADLEIVDGPSLTEQVQALDGGTAVFVRDTHQDAPVFVKEAVTTYTNDSQSPVDREGNKTKPVSLYRRVKNIAIQHAIELEVREWATSGEILGDQPVDEATREIVLGRFRIAYETRQTARIVQPGWTVRLDGEPDDDDDFVACAHGFHPTRSLRQIFNVARIG